MKKYNLLLCAVGIFTVCGYTFAQQKGNTPERFFDVNAYRAEISFSFTYKYSQTEPEYTKVVTASQTFDHTFTTGPGQISAADMFQVERGDEAEVASGDNSGMMGGMDMEAISEAMKNSGMDPSIMEELKKTKKETGSYSMDFGKYKMWMSDPVSGGSVSTRTASEYALDESGITHCGEGQGKGRFSTKIAYGGTANVQQGTPGRQNPNSLLLLINLTNNSYSFSTSVQVPEGFNFKGTDIRQDCGTSTEKHLTPDARSFMDVKSPKEGLIYKQDLPASGMTLSGSRDITDLLTLKSPLDKSGEWTVRINWKIYPAGG